MSNKTVTAWDREQNVIVQMREAKVDANTVRYFKNPIFPDALQARIDNNDALLRWRDYKLDEGTGTVVEKSQSDKDTEAAQVLSEEKMALVKQVDAIVDKRIQDGSFTHAGKEFSITSTAQIKWIGLFNAKDSLAYPMVVYTKDDTASHDIADAAEVTTMYGLAVGAVRAILDAGTAAKVAIQVSADRAAAQAAFDAYANP